jgi:hypothetical protein
MYGTGGECVDGGSEDCVAYGLVIRQHGDHGFGGGDGGGWGSGNASPGGFEWCDFLACAIVDGNFMTRAQ